MRNPIQIFNATLILLTSVLMVGEAATQEDHESQSALKKSERETIQKLLNPNPYDNFETISDERLLVECMIFHETREYVRPIFRRVCNQNEKLRIEILRFFQDNPSGITDDFGFLGELNFRESVLASLLQFPSTRQAAGELLLDQKNDVFSGLSVPKSLVLKIAEISGLKKQAHAALPEAGWQGFGSTPSGNSNPPVTLSNGAISQQNLGDKHFREWLMLKRNSQQRKKLVSKIVVELQPKQGPQSADAESFLSEIEIERPFLQVYLDFLISGNETQTKIALKSFAHSNQALRRI